MANLLSKVCNDVCTELSHGLGRPHIALWIIITLLLNLQATTRKVFNYLYQHINFGLVKCTHHAYPILTADAFLDLLVCLCNCLRRGWQHVLQGIWRAISQLMINYKQIPPLMKDTLCGSFVGWE